MNQNFRPLVVRNEIHEKGIKLCAKWKAAGLGRLTLGTIFEAGLTTVEGRINKLVTKVPKGK